MNDFEDLLRERFRSLKDSVEPPPDLWDEIEQRAAKRERSPGLIVAAAAVVLVLGLALYTIGTRGSGTNHKVVADGGSADEPCGPVPKASDPGYPQADLQGPAPSALTGGAARSSFSIDGGGLIVNPPREGDDPAVPRAAVECDALTSMPTFGSPLLSQSMLGSASVAIGYGRATLAGDLKDLPGGVQTWPGGRGPAPPPPSPYQDRLAWIVVVHDVEASSCPSGSSAETDTVPPKVATDYGYRVLLVDARSGGSAVMYTEGGPATCGGPGRQPPTISVPLQRVSVPWTLAKRDAHDYSATIDIEVLPCDHYPETVNVDRYRPMVTVVVERPIGAKCGASTSAPITLVAASVFENLPATLEHAPLGPFLGPPEPSAAPPTTTLPPLTMTQDDNGKTITVKVGSVVAVDPLGSMPPFGPTPVVSSDPSVLGLLGPPGPPVGEFRAWRAGTADLTIPGRWRVHVIVQ